MNAFKILKFFLLLVLTVNKSESYNELYDSDESDLENICPKICKCDSYNNDLNRADCSDQNLITTNTGVSRHVEYLDLSRNKISLINDHSFKTYTNIQILDMSYNTINTLGIKSFAPLKNLQKLDLSYNRIEQLDQRLFEFNLQLTQLDLSGNKFMSLHDVPLVKSESLQELVLKDCKLVYIPHLMFHHLPNLNKLDLSQNLLKVVHVKSFTKMKDLVEVNVEDNVWNCDDEMHKVLKWFKRRGVEVKRNQCYKVNKGDVAFEKIVHATTEEPRRDVKVELVWNITKSYFTVENTTPAQIIYPYKIMSINCTNEIDEYDKECSIDSCKSNLMELFTENEELKREIENYKINHFSAIMAMCYVGLFFGALGGGMLVYIICYCRDRNIKKSFTEPLERQRLRKAYKNRSQYAHAKTATRKTTTATTEQTDSETDSPPTRIASPISPSRIPSFRNSIEPTVPRSLTPLRHPQVETHRIDPNQRLYRQKATDRYSQEQELPTFLKYFRRSQQGPRTSGRMSISPEQARRLNNNQEDTYFLPSPTTSTPPNIPRQRLQTQPSDPGAGVTVPIVTRQLSNAVSNTSVIYNEIDETSQIPQDMCCTSHITREIDALTVDLLKEANTVRTSVTPPPPYIDCMSISKLNRVQTP